MVEFCLFLFVFGVLESCFSFSLSSFKIKSFSCWDPPKNVFYLLFCPCSFNLSILSISKPIIVAKRLKSANGFHAVLLVLVPTISIGLTMEEGLDLQKNFKPEECWMVGKLLKAQIYLRLHVVCGPTETNHKNYRFFSEKNLHAIIIFFWGSAPIKKVKCWYIGLGGRAFELRIGTYQRHMWESFLRDSRIESEFILSIVEYKFRCFRILVLER